MSSITLRYQFAPPPSPSAVPSLSPLVLGSSGADQVRGALSLEAAFKNQGRIILSSEPLDPSVEITGSTAPGVTFFTSGTSGTPKPVYKSWAELTSNVATQGNSQDRFLLTFNLVRFAGLQVFFHCLRHQCTLAVAERLLSPESFVADGSALEITHLSVTPSMLKGMLAHRADVRLKQLKQITLGGENTSPADLQFFHRAFPKVRFTRIYASSEAGACFATSDLEEGFPLSLLDRMHGGRTGVLTEGQLVLKMPNGKVLETGDYFLVRQNRLIFEGRREDFISVAGLKVSPLRIEEVIRKFPGVIACRVWGKKNIVVGEVPMAEVVGTYEPEALRAFCLTNLNKSEMPASINKVDSIKIADTGKTLRQRE